MSKFIGPLTWVWLIIIGGLMITPGGIECIKCGAPLTKLIGGISVVLGIAGFVFNQRKVSERG